MKLKDVETPEDYLSYFFQKQEELDFASSPKLDRYFQQLCQSFLEIGMVEEPLFLQIKQLLQIEAKLQILLFFMEYKKNDSLDLSETEIIQLINNDSHCFFREIVGQRKDSPISWSLINLGESIGENDSEEVF